MGLLKILQEEGGGGRGEAMETKAGGGFSQKMAGLSYTGSEIINVHKTKEQSERNNA